MKHVDTDISDETAMAYADGELDPAAAAAVATALREDPALAARVEQHRALRAGVQTAFASDLSEPVPQQLVDAVLLASPEVTGGASVASLDVVRAQRNRSSWGSPLPLAAAASLVLGVALGFFLWHRPGALLRETRDGALVAGGTLARVLSDQLADVGKPNGITVWLSFQSKSGGYCRVFRIERGGAAAGLACRSGTAWRIEMLAPSEDARAAGTGDYRMAGSSLPAALLDTVQARIAGAPLDRAGELAARGRDWQPAPR